MYVCVCKAVSEGHVRECVRSGHCSLREVSARTGLATQCGRCARHARSVIGETLSAMGAVERGSDCQTA